MSKPKKVKKLGLVPLSDSQLRNKYKGSGLASSVIVDPEKAIWLPSSSLAITNLLGGGVPYGKILEIFGEESSGKTLLAYDFAITAQKLGGFVIWDDAEQAFDQHWALALGLDLDRVEVYNETSIEIVSDWVADSVVNKRRQLIKNEPIVFVCDSIAALDCEANINSVQTDHAAEMGNRARAFYRMLRVRNQLTSKLGIVSIYINQLRKKVGVMFEDPDTTPGGKAMAFYASQRMGIYGGKQVKKKINGVEQRVGIETSLRMKKNKVAPPKMTIRTEVSFHPDTVLGFSRYLGSLEALIETGAIVKKGGYLYLSTTNETLCQGETRFYKLMEEEPEFRKKVIAASSINTISKTRERIASLGRNYFPIPTNLASLLDDDDDDEDYNDE